MLSFYIFTFLMAVAIIISLADQTPVIYMPDKLVTANTSKTTKRVKLAWITLIVVMICLYLVFNGH
jgi:SSS family solute:Na+ symporter